MSYRLFVDSSTGVTVEPVYGSYQDSRRKIEDNHRTRGGKLYRYKWSDFERFTFEVSYVNSSFRAVVNSWWGGNEALLWKNESDSVVTSVYITNRDSPIDTLQPPYQDLWQGSIELEGY